MTIFGPDISNYQSGMTLQSGTVFVLAKASEGTYYTDASYASFKAQSEHLGAVFSGYHFITTEDPAAQAALYFKVAGSTPCMVDCEPTGNYRPTVDTVLAFKKALEGLGGRVWAVYFPQWYQSEVGGNLGALQSAGAVIISSTYTGYTDSGPGWLLYGGMNEPPALWQYTNAQSYSGHTVDFNAFKGTAEQLAELVNGTGVDLTTEVTFSPAVVQQFPDLAAEGFGGSTNLETIWLWTAARVAHLVNQVNTLTATVSKIQGGSVDPAVVASDVIADLKNDL